MDPLSITAAAGSLAASIFALVKFIGSFVTTARDSRTDLEAVSRELISLQVCLEVLESDRRNGTLFGENLEVSVSQVLINIEVTCGQIESMLAKVKSARFGRPVKWATQQKDQMTNFRSSLETHKSALQIALQLNTISIVVKQTQNLRNSQSISTNARQVDETYSTLQQISQKVDDLVRDRDQLPSNQRLYDAMADLSSTIQSAVSTHGSLVQLARESCRVADESITTLPNTGDLQGIRTKLEEIVQNPFIDPFNEIKYVSPNRLDISAAGPPDHMGATSRCVICDNHINDADKSVVEGNLQQLRIDWRRKWTVQLKQELISLGEQTSGVNPTASDRIANVDFHRGTTNASEVDDITDLLSEVMTITSWNNNDSKPSISDMKSVSSQRSTSYSDTISKMQRLQRKCDSTQKRNQLLLEEITELKQENLELQDDISRLEDRLAKAQTGSSRQVRILQRERENLQSVADQASEDLDQLNLSYDKLRDERTSEQKELKEELVSLRSKVQSQSSGMTDLNVSAEKMSQELARLQALEVNYNRAILQRYWGRGK